MSPPKLAVVCATAAMGLSACATAVKPATGSRGRVDDPRTARSDRVNCLKQAQLPVQEVGVSGLQIGPLPAGPTVVFAPTPAAAQGQQVQGQAQGAEVIGGALLYPNQASEGELTKIENCLARGVSG